MEDSLGVKFEVGDRVVYASSSPTALLNGHVTAIREGERRPKPPKVDYDRGYRWGGRYVWLVEPQLTVQTPKQKLVKLIRIDNVAIVEKGNKNAVS